MTQRLWSKAAPVLLALSAASAWGAEPGAQRTPVETELLTVLVGLGGVVLLIFGLAWLVRRFGSLPQLGNQQMKVVSALSVGTRERVVLIEVGGEQLLLGVAQGRVGLLHHFAEPVVSAERHRGEFGTKMKQFLQQGNKQS